MIIDEIRKDIVKFLESNEDENSIYQNFWESKGHAREEVHKYEFLHLKPEIFQINKPKKKKTDSKLVDGKKQ
jgi:hypothetical protein